MKPTHTNHNYIMKKQILVIALLLISSLVATAQLKTGTNGQLVLTGVAPLETIVANASTLESKLDVGSRKFNFRQDLTDFSFSKGQLQKKHAEERFWEVEKFPYATFEGQIINMVNLTKPGTYPVTAQGKFSIHGVAKEISVPAEISVTGSGQVNITAIFKVYLSDHNIEIPKLNVKKVADEFTVEVTTALK